MERKVKLQITGMEKKYKNGDGVENINIDVYEGEFVTMLGPSGCGKSTILRTLGGFLDIDKGDILIDGQSVKDLPPEKRPTAMVFQSYNLWPHMTVYENLAFGLEIKKVPKNVIRSEIERGLKLVNMSGYEKKYPGQLSGGQQQRIAIARALLLKPSVLLLDEPFSALDAKIRAQMREELKRIQEELNITVVFVTHDQEEAMALSHRIVVMNKGFIEQIGTPTGDLRSSGHPVCGFLHWRNEFPDKAGRKFCGCATGGCDHHQGRGPGADLRRREDHHGPGPFCGGQCGGGKPPGDQDLCGQKCGRSAPYEGPGIPFLRENLPVLRLMGSRREFYIKS